MLTCALCINMSKSVYIRIDRGNPLKVILQQLRNLDIPVHQGGVLVRKRTVMPLGHRARLVGKQ
jgi:hypothetical protein